MQQQDHARSNRGDISLLEKHVFCTENRQHFEESALESGYRGGKVIRDPGNEEKKVGDVPY